VGGSPSAEMDITSARVIPASSTSLFSKVFLLCRKLSFFKTLGQDKSEKGRNDGTFKRFLKPEQHYSFACENVSAGSFRLVRIRCMIQIAMSSGRGKALLDRTAGSDLWRNTLSQIPTIFGRLFYLASLRNQNSGRYEHHGLALLFGSLEASRALKKSHRQTFKEWMAFNLEQQHADLELFFSEQPEDKRTILKAWEQLEPYRNVLPNTVKDVERKHFLSNLRAILRLFKNASGAWDSDPEA
jgi:hypothetical protein